MSEYEFVTGWDQLDAFNYTENFCNFAFDIVSSACCKNILFVGSSDGIVAKYISSELEHEKFQTCHDRYIILKKKFPIVQMQALALPNILIACCDKKIHLLDMTSLKILKVLEENQKFHGFDTYCSFMTGSSSIQNKNNDYLLTGWDKYKIKNYRMMNHDVNSSVVLMKFKEIVGFLYLDASNVLVIHRDGCTSYSIRDKEVYIPVYSTGKNNHTINVNQIHFNLPYNICPPFLSHLSVPSTSKISETVKTLFENLKIASMLLITDKYHTHIFLYFHSGNFFKILTISWNDQPIVVEFSFPYVVAFFRPGRVEIRYGCSFVQNLTFKNFEITHVNRDRQFLNKSDISSSIFAFSKRMSYRIYQFPIKVQVEHAIAKECHFVGSILANYLDLSDDSNYLKFHQIKTNCALWFFSVGKYKDCFEIFQELKTDIASVVNLIPGILLHEFPPQVELKRQSRIQFPILRGGDLELAIRDLMNYLIDIRLALPHRDPDDFRYNITTNMLLRCYILVFNTYIIQVNHQMVLPFLSLCKNSCLVEEIEQLLKEHQLYKELSYYYSFKSLHCQAISMIQTLKNNPEFEVFITIFFETTQISSIDILCQYFQSLLDKQPDLVFKFISKNLSKFCIQNLEKLTRFVFDKMPTYEAQYLDLVVNEWEIIDPWYHNLYILSKIGVMELMLKEYYFTHSKYIRPGDEEGLLGDEHKQLLELLVNNPYYEPNKVISKLSYTNFYYERLIVYDKLKQNRIAFENYLNRLSDHVLLEQFCLEQYSINKARKYCLEQCSEPFFLLTELYFELANPENKFEEIGIELFFKNLHYFSDMQVSNILCKFPLNYPLKKLFPVISKSFSNYTNLDHHSLAINNIASLSVAKFRYSHCQYFSKKNILNQTTECLKCKKVIGLSSFLAKLDGSFVHYHCSK